MNKEVAPTSTERFDSLTGVRFFAALAVLSSHVPKPPNLPDMFATLFDAGYNGVTIFFVLSGFVIGLNYFETLARPDWRVLFRFFAARLARIYPLYFLVLLFKVWLDLGAYPNQNLMTHLLAIQAWSPSLGVAYEYNAPGWSIGVEFFLYACFPVIALLLAPLARRKGILWFLASVGIVYLFLAALFFIATGRAALPWNDPESAHRWLYRTPVTRLADFSLGIIAALLVRRSSRDELAGSQCRWTFVTYSAFIMILLLMMWPPNLFSAFSFDASYAPIAYFLILGLTLAPNTKLSRFLASRSMVILGEASFALYLIHAPLLKIFRIEDYADFDPIGQLGLRIAFVGIGIALSIGLNAFVETPVRRFINDRVNLFLITRTKTRVSGA